MSENEIAALPKFAFEKLTFLARVDLKYNKLKGLAAEIFFNNLDLSYVDFTGNNIEIISEDLFRQNCSFLEVDLSYNRCINDKFNFPYELEKYGESVKVNCSIFSAMGVAN